jgi:hypothetical protein
MEVYFTENIICKWAILAIYWLVVEPTPLKKMKVRLHADDFPMFDGSIKVNPPTTSNVW